jgi:hypothetical protein
MALLQFNDQFRNGRLRHFLFLFLSAIASVACVSSCKIPAFATFAPFRGFPPPSKPIGRTREPHDLAHDLPIQNRP